MDNVFFNFSIPLIKKLDDGKTIKIGFKYFFYVMGALSLLGILGALYGFFQAPSFGGFLVVLGLIFGLWISFQIFFYRAKSIESISPGNFVVSHIVSIYIKTMGEVLGAIMASVGVMVGLASIFAGSELSSIPGADIFLSYGIGALVMGPIMAFLTITLFYFISETVLCLPAIGRNSTNIAKKLDADGGKDDNNTTTNVQDQLID